ncbi:MAG: mechanosensitive ion channel domain-containing protein [Candidatus Zixiibacteriota bacterium]
MVENITDIITGWGVNESVALYIGWFAIIMAILVLSIITNYIAKKILLVGITRIIRKTKISWDDALLEHNVFTRLSHIAPALVIYFSAELFSPNLRNYIQRFSTVYMFLTGWFVLSAFLNAAVSIYQKFEKSRQRPIKGYVQITKIIVFVFIAVYAIGIILDKSVLPILGGLGAMTAVIILVFKDSILGLVASIQLSGNDMVRIGDWIEIPKYGADGDVIDITLTTIKVQNWDKTISYIPAYALVSDSYKNWRGMTESGGRRIKRAINIDMNTVKFAAPEMLEKWQKFRVLKDYLKTKQEEIARYNKELNIDSTPHINGRNLTNLGTFRAYLGEYLKNHPKINKEMTFLIRHLQPTDKGIPIEIYVFSNDKVWANYESIQADIFDHVLAVIPEFDLRVFQNPSGNDIKKLIETH